MIFMLRLWSYIDRNITGGQAGTAGPISATAAEGDTLYDIIIIIC